jgi:hypothetical protein
MLKLETLVTNLYPIPNLETKPYLLTSLYELDGKELLGCDISNQLSHAKISRPDIFDQLVLLHCFLLSALEARKATRARGNHNRDGES